MHIKQIVVLLLAHACIVSCQSKEAQRQEIMAEIERLDLLRKKTNELVLEHKSALLSRKRNYQTWKSELLSLYRETVGIIEQHEKAIARYNSASGLFDGGLPKKLRENVQEIQKILVTARKTRDRIKKQIAELEPVSLKQISELEASLNAT